MDEFDGKTLVILGLARQGKALARFAAKAGATVIISDLRPAEKLGAATQDLADLEIEYVFGAHPMRLIDEADVLAISGGVPADAPFVNTARERNIPITNDSQTFIRRTPTAVIGITGSAGKTTTTALTGVMGQIAGRRTWVGGNIGKPLIADLHKMAADDMVVQELSSFQLEIWTQSPAVAAVLNITPNHLDRHKTMKAYVQAKANILRYQPANGIAVLCADDAGSLALKGLAQGRVRLFSRQRQVADGAFVDGGWIWLADGQGGKTAVCPCEAIQLRGEHNVLNVLAATTLADSVGISVEAIAHAIGTFKGVEHRLELVRTLNGVQYINDSIATAPERALAALSAFDEPLVLLAGGRDKMMVWESWVETVHKRVKQVILFGDMAEMLVAKLADYDGESNLAVTQVQTLAEAVQAGSETAVAGDIVLLSPGGTSYDAYEDFAERGQHFRTLVGDLCQP